MAHKIGEGWTATTERAESSYGRVVYLAASCSHGREVAHSLEEALVCGLLQAARAAWGQSQQDAAIEMGVSIGAVRAWEAGTRTPIGLYRTAVEFYIRGGRRAGRRGG